MSGIDWPGLLRWSTNYHDGTKPTEFKPLSKEDRDWLEKAMEAATAMIEDYNKMMQEAIAQLKAEDRTEPSVISALEVCDRCCDDPDVCRNVEKFDGIRALLDIVGAYGVTTTVRILEILALMLSNNPSIQEPAVQKHDALKVFIDLFRASPAGSEVRCKALRAAVASVRNVEALEQKFLSDFDGVSLLRECMAPEEDARTREKAVAFVQGLVSNQRIGEEDARKLCEALVPLIAGIGDDAELSLQYYDALDFCLSAYAERFPALCGELRTAVEARISALSGRSGEDPALSMLKGCAERLPK
eukprot:TRINITY_DN21893_c0_g7_i2.p1 TRINITY_DN21893_c0_g7~~TRINITY_DN21893_c0_g7_i2.p1  ORF type:complete len:302 (+),score=83.50 TRINITY_DN21893_c0_g7_i2:132-1037(+)